MRLTFALIPIAWLQVTMLLYWLLHIMYITIATSEVFVPIYNMQVSKGAECIMISKQFLQREGPTQVLQWIRNEVYLSFSIV